MFLINRRERDLRTVIVEVMDVTHLQRFLTLDMCDTLLLSFADHPNHGMRGMEIKRPLASENLVQDRATGKKTTRFNIRIRQLAVMFSYTDARARAVTRRRISRGDEISPRSFAFVVPFHGFASQTCILLNDAGHDIVVQISYK